MEFNFRDIEARWKQAWKEQALYKTEIDEKKEKYYVLDMFPYPSGAGLHVGHPLGYIASDIFSRFKRLQGFNVLHPMGFDAFGLPAEEYAIATGVHPAVSTRDNIARYKEQLSNIGFSFDWSRQVITCEPSYYKWTQWIFTRLFLSYYDLDENKAKGIEALIEKFEKSGSAGVNAFCGEHESFTAEQWTSMSSLEKSDVLTSYRLAYRRIGYVNWCEALGTVLANDQIKDGVSERGGHPVERKAMTQWYLRITAYAERLLEGLDSVDWPESLKAMQTNWIGKSKGARIDFIIEDSNEKLEIFTTRPDTIFGASFMVLAPEHPLIAKITSPKQKAEIKDYQEYVSTRSERDRLSDVKEVSGAFTGAYASHPFNDSKIPIWISEYVLMDYGTGAIMAVPADDERDFAFAGKFDLPVIEIIDRSEYPESKREDKVGKLMNSSFLDGLEIPDAIDKINERIESQGIGTIKVNYKMRDANFSRQRYWGEPFPIVFDKNNVPHAVDLDDLPVRLPDTDEFKPTKDGQSPLSRIKDWVHNGDTIRETDTMPAVAGSSWYFLRYMDPLNDKEFASKQAIDYWKDVDLYVGGAEHAVSHLLYARFWHKFLYDLGYLNTEEPFRKLINQGMIQGVIEYILLSKSESDENIFNCASLVEADASSNFARIPVHIDFIKDYGSPNSYMDRESLKQFLSWRPDYKKAKFKSSDGTIYTANQILENESLDIRLETLSEVGKMSKRYYNVVNPDDVVDMYGADCFRLYEMFLGPVEQSKPWDTQGIEGVSKFIKKFWGLFHDNEDFSLSDEKATKAELKILHQTIKKVQEDILAFSFNTAISAMMICVNELRKLSCNKREILEPLVRVIAPFAPFLSEELWHKLGHSESVHNSSYPEFMESYLKEDEIEYPICVNGKKRFSYLFPAEYSKDKLAEDALSLEELSKWTDGKTVVKTIVVPGRMINIVVK